MTVTPQINVVYEQDSGQSTIAQTGLLVDVYSSPYAATWYVSRAATNIPQESLGWMLANGWWITQTDVDNTTNPPTVSYDMEHLAADTSAMLDSLTGEWARQYNSALAANAVRYNDIVTNWDSLIENNHAYWTSMVGEQNEFTTSYMDDIDTYMDAVDADIVELEQDWALHAPAADSYLTNLGATDEARIIEEFEASLGKQLQGLIDHGLYSSAVAADITARNTRDRDEQIQLLNDRLNREKFDNQHRTYEQQFAMKSRTIADRTTAAKVRQDALALSHSTNLDLMKYVSEQQNQLVIGLYGFVERRDDIYPSFESLVQIATGLGDAGGGWVTP